MAELDKTLVNIVGPTAVGKTSLSIEIAQKLNCPILSTDSRQFYHEMTIGTAKPTPAELSQVEHHFINSRHITERYTAGMFEQDALYALKSIFSKNDYCVTVGGSGLYINALAFGIDDIPSDENVRTALLAKLEEKGLEAMQEKLKEVDPDYYEEADIKNPRRVMRALEVYEISGQPYSTFRKKEHKSRPFKQIWIGLEMELEELYERINQRVDLMLQDGLFEEVEQLMPHKDTKAMKSVGYQEIVGFYEGNVSKEEAIELVKRNSRRFARKQLGWFRKNQEISWFHPSESDKIHAYLQANK